MTDARALHDFASRAEEAFGRSCTYLLKLIRILGDASRKLGRDEFADLLAGLPFDASTGRHFAALAGDPRFATRHASSETIAALVAPALAIGSAPQPPVEDAPAAPDGKPAATVRASPRRIKALTGLEPDEFRSLISMSDAEWTRVSGIGITAWRRESATATKSTPAVQQVGPGNFQISNFAEAAE